MYLTVVQLLLPLACAITIPAPTGRFHTGLIAYVLNHTTFNDPVAPSKTGESLLINLYYPTLDPTELIAYIFPELSAFYETTYGLHAGTFSNVTAQVALNGLPISSPDCFERPTLLFGPPAAGPPSQMFFALFSELASQGYTVVTVDHPYEAPFVKYPNGTVFPGLPLDGGGVSAEDIYSYRLTDNTALIDALPSVSRGLYLPMNLTHLITFGHSLGGSAALETALIERSRPNIKIIGALNIDGSLNGRVNTSDADLGVPALLLASSMNPDNPDFKRFAEEQSKWSRIIRTDGKSNHTDYSDLIVWKQGAGVTGGRGAISAQRMVKLVRTLVLDYVGFLLGKGEGILKGGEDVLREWPELVFEY